jgi:type IV secretion system protein VirB4
VLNLREYAAKPKRLYDWLTWGALIAPSVVLNKDGCFMTILSFRGPDLESSTPEILTASRTRLNHALKFLGSGWCVHVESRRGVSPPYPKAASFPDPVSRLIEEEREAAFNAHERYFENVFFLTLTYLTPPQAVKKSGGFLLENDADAADPASLYKTSLDLFQTTVNSVADILASAMTAVRQLGDDELLTYLHACISTKSHMVRRPDIPAYLDCFLTDDDLTLGLKPKLGDAHLGVVSVRSFPDWTQFGMFDRLNDLGFSYRWVSRFLPMDKDEALAALNTTRKRWFQGRKPLSAMLAESASKQESIHVNPDADARFALAEDAMAVIGADRTTYGYYCCNIVVTDRDPIRLSEKTRAVAATINALGFVAKPETVNTVEAWFSTLPGNPYANVRQPLITGFTFCDLLPGSAVWPGPYRNEHLTAQCAQRGHPGVQPPLMWVATTGRTPFRLSLHQGDLAHTEVLGPTGAGKSVLLNSLCVQHLRYPEARVIFFDVGSSSRAATLLTGGAFYALGGDSADGDIAFQPLHDLDTPSSREWATSWIEDIAASQNIHLTPEHKREIYGAVMSLFNTGPERRTLTTFRALLQSEILKDAIAPFCSGGAFAHLLDAHHTEVQAANWLTFEMGELMGSKALIPVVTYIFHAIEKLFDGRPTLLVLDEAWAFLSNDAFSQKIRDWLRTLRKFNVGVVFATQSLADIVGSAIAPVLLESCPTKIFLPNPQAQNPETASYYKSIGLNSTQIQRISEAIPKRDYYVTCHDGNRLVSLALGPIALAVVGSSSKNDQALMDHLLAHYGKDGFGPAFFRAKGLDDVARRLEADLYRSGMHQ